MATRQYLAMTAGEIAENPSISPGICWMACHFSSCEEGLSNLPLHLPDGALLVLDDSIPMEKQDIEEIARQLQQLVTRLNCFGLFLDFQRPGYPEYAELARVLSKTLPCPVILSELYAGNLTNPVCLPPVPPSVPLSSYLSPWEGRSVWLELGLDGEEIVLTEQGCAVTPLPRFLPPKQGHQEKELHCHYTISQMAGGIRFTLWRTWEDLQALIREAEECGAAGTVGLYQELHSFLPKQNKNGTA